MANALNNFPCALLGSNTGFGTCVVDFKNITDAFIVPAGTSFSQTETLTPAAFLTALIAATSAVKASRLYPIHNLAEINDGSEGPVTEKLGYGAELNVRDGSFKWGFRILKGGFCLSKALRAFNDMNVDVFFVDADGLVIGQRNVASDGTVTFGGIPQYQVYQAPLKINDGSKNTIYMQNFSFPGNVFDSFGGVQLTPVDVAMVVGLQPIYLYGATRSTNVSVVKGTIGCVGDDLGTTLGATLADVDLWTVTDAVTGNTYATITSVSYSTTNKTYTITVPTADPAYNAGNPVILSLAAASVLDAAGLHYESNTAQTAS
jgi:hypothetical protein